MMFGRKPGKDEPPPESLPARLPVLEGAATARPLPLDDPDHPDRDLPPRSFRQKMWDMPISGWINLALICLGVGVLLSLSQINVFEPGFTLGGALGQLVDGVLRGLGWVISRGWQPFLFGALVVVPVWLAWRAVSAPFRK